MKKNIIIGLLVAALIISGSYIAFLINHNNQENEIKESEKQKQSINNQKETKKENKEETKDTEEVQHTEETKEATYTCDKCGKGTDKNYISEGDMLLCKSCADATPVYLTDSECEGLYGSSYMCNTCGRFFAKASNRDLCNHGVCKACQRYGKVELDPSMNEVIFIDGIGDICLVHATQAEKTEGQY